MKKQTLLWMFSLALLLCLTPVMACAAPVVPDDISNSIPSSGSHRVSDAVAVVPGNISDDIPDSRSDCISEAVTVVPDNIPENLPVFVSNAVSGTEAVFPDKVPNNLPDNIPDDISNSIPSSGSDCVSDAVTGNAAHIGKFSSDNGLFSATIVNPLYKNVPAPQPDVSQAENSHARTASGAPYRSPAGYALTYLTEREAANLLRQAMVNRDAEVSFHVQTPAYWFDSAEDNWLTTVLFPLCCSQELSDCPYDGDYLRWSWHSFQFEMKTLGAEQYEMTLRFRYYTDLSQETEVWQRVTSLVSELGLSAMTPVDAYAAIYDYITANVAYDYEAEASSMQDPDGELSDYSPFTAWGALLQGRAVCQGYSALYYALCREARLPVRILTSETHAWNIVYLKDIWYEVDSTWDSATESHRDWFLLGEQRFTLLDLENHLSSTEYRETAFREEYPISAYDYDPDIPYNDVPKLANVYYDGISGCTERGILNGTGPYTFSPQQDIDRAMVVTVLWRLEGRPAAAAATVFADVAEDAYYAGAVAWASENGIAEGVGSGFFSPEGKTTREQLATFLYRYIRYKQEDISVEEIPIYILDAYRISDYAREAIAWALGTGLIRGTTSVTVSPDLVTSREQLATILMRMIEYYEY